MIKFSKISDEIKEQKQNFFNVFNFILLFRQEISTKIALIFRYYEKKIDLYQGSYQGEKLIKKRNDTQNEGIKPHLKLKIIQQIIDKL